MATSVQEPEKVKAGEEINLKLYAGGKEYEVSETVLPSCGNNEPNAGHWACAVHLNRYDPEGENCLDEYGRSFTGREGCRAVWICHEHGPEQP